MRTEYLIFWSMWLMAFCIVSGCIFAALWRIGNKLEKR